MTYSNTSVCPALAIHSLKIWNILLVAILASPILDAVRSESPVLTWTAHYTARGRLVERRFSDTGVLYQCHVYGDRVLAETALEAIPRDNQFLTDEHNFQRLVSECPNDRASREMRARNKRAFTVIFPGTKWCGTGNIANDSSDLGPLMEEDMCCRAHDSCPVYILPGQTKYSITNKEIASVTTCECDQNFYDCLKAAGTLAANVIGGIYFNAVDLPCLEASHPEICSGFWFWKRCTKDTSRQKRLTLVQSNFTF